MKSASLALAAVLTLAAGAPSSAQAPAVVATSAADWRTPDPENVLVVDTSKGRIIVELEPRIAPAHAERYRTLARRGFYDGLEFFRVIEGFMDQTGDPKNDGTGGSDLPDLKIEIPFRRGAEVGFTSVGKLPADGSTPSATEVGFVGAMPVRGAPSMQMMVAVDGKAPGWGLFCPGVLGAARSGDPHSANSQFFFMRDAYPSLDASYTAFGRVLAGQDVVRAIKVGEPVAPPRDRMTKVRVLADIPAGERPKVQVMDTAGPAFRALVEKARGTAAVVDPCSIEIPARIG